MSKRIVLRTKGLTKHFGPVKAVEGLDLTVQRGEILGYLGPNGAGKQAFIHRPELSTTFSRICPKASRPSWAQRVRRSLRLRAIYTAKCSPRCCRWHCRNIIAQGLGLDAILLPLGLSIVFATAGVWLFGRRDLH